VVESCIYGVDVNDLAVELAKLSLWILSMDGGMPLSFLNPHLRRGNSLIGARLADIGRFPRVGRSRSVQLQPSFFGENAAFKEAVATAIDRYASIEQKDSTSLNAIEEKKSLLAEAEQDLAPYKSICSFHTHVFFDRQIDDVQYQAVLDGSSDPSLVIDKHGSDYFHWELEFPGICLSKGGFTCIVCNPPYDTFTENAYFAAARGAGTGNLFSHFIASQIPLNAQDGSIGFVVPLSLACGST